MEHAQNPYQATHLLSAADASVDERASFITKTYLHLAVAIGLLVVLETALVRSPLGRTLMELMLGSQYSWLVVLGLFTGASWLADSWARSSTSLAKQYSGLVLYTAAQAVIMLPLVYYVMLTKPQAIVTAGVVTLIMVAILTAVVFITRKDFSFLRSVLIFGSIASLVTVIVAVIFNLELGSIFSVLMVALACVGILYSTSQVLHDYRVDQHVSAALALFASVALLFYYVLRLLASRD